MTSERLSRLTDPAEIGARRALTRMVLLLVAAGALVQLALSAYYLGVAHAPGPRNLPVGYVATAEDGAKVEAQLAGDDKFDAESYADETALLRAMREKEIYGGVDLTGDRPHLYVASAAGPSASTVIRAAFDQVLGQQVADQVAQLSAAGQPVPPATVAALTAAPEVTDVAPLPKDDSSGGSIGLLVQALALGATIASLGLGRIGKETERSLRRGVGHAATLVVYALVSAAVVVASASWFGVLDGHDVGSVFLDFALLSLAITASTAAAVALIGPLGALLGTLYFTLGLIISGSGILPEFLPTFGRVVGQALPTGAGVKAIRESLYFPDASTAGPVAVLCAYAGVGLLVVLVVNALPSRARSI